jgi:hypothetical protein
MIKVQVKGSFNKTQTFLHRMQRREQFRGLERYGAKGVAALKTATPEDSTQTANSWSYEIVNKPGYFAIHWFNSNLDVPRKTPIAVLLQYGHGTRNGGYVEGRDYINPALQPIFDQIATEMWKEVTK